MFASRNSSWVGIRIMQDPLDFRSNLIQLPLSLFNLWTFALSQSRMNEWQKVSFPGLATLLKRVNNFFSKCSKNVILIFYGDKWLWSWNKCLHLHWILRIIVIIDLKTFGMPGNNKTLWDAHLWLNKSLNSFKIKCKL